MKKKMQNKENNNFAFLLTIVAVVHSFTLSIVPLVEI